MSSPPASVDALVAETGFSGVVRADRGDELSWTAASGLADRRHQIPNTVDTQFGLASGVKGLTAATVVSLVAEGTLSMDTPARTLLGTDLPLVDDTVTIEHLLAHRSGIGDYLDEDELDDITAYPLDVPVHTLDDPEAYLPVLDGHRTKFAAGEGFSYCNGGYVILALIAQRVTGTSFPQLVDQRVCRPAGLTSTAFLRSDELPARAALGYLGEGPRTNVLHLPVLGSGDGGIYSTAEDLHRFWTALFDGRIVPAELVRSMVSPRSVMPADHRRYGLGLWLHESTDVVWLTGHDAGVSLRSVHSPETSLTHTTISNTSNGAWPITAHLDTVLST